MISKTYIRIKKFVANKFISRNGEGEGESGGKMKQNSDKRENYQTRKENEYIGTKEHREQDKDHLVSTQIDRQIFLLKFMDVLIDKQINKHILR